MSIPVRIIQRGDVAALGSLKGGPAQSLPWGEMHKATQLVRKEMSPANVILRSEATKNLSHGRVALRVKNRDASLRSA